MKGQEIISIINEGAAVGTLFPLNSFLLFIAWCQGGGTILRHLLSLPHTLGCHVCMDEEVREE